MFTSSKWNKKVSTQIHEITHVNSFFFVNTSKAFYGVLRCCCFCCWYVSCCLFFIFIFFFCVMRVPYTIYPVVVRFCLRICRCKNRNEKNKFFYQLLQLIHNASLHAHNMHNLIAFKNFFKSISALHIKTLRFLSFDSFER